MARFDFLSCSQYADHHDLSFEEDVEDKMLPIWKAAQAFGKFRTQPAGRRIFRNEIKKVVEAEM